MHGSNFPAPPPPPPQAELAGGCFGGGEEEGGGGGVREHRRRPPSGGGVWGAGPPSGASRGAEPSGGGSRGAMPPGVRRFLKISLQIPKLQLKSGKKYCYSIVFNQQFKFYAVREAPCPPLYCIVGRKTPEVHSRNIQDFRGMHKA